MVGVGPKPLSVRGEYASDASQARAGYRSFGKNLPRAAGSIFIGSLDRSGKTTMRAFLASHPNIAIPAVGSNMWTYFYGQFGDLAHRENYAIVRYEAFAERPLETIRDICAFVGEDFAAPTGDALRAVSFTRQETTGPNADTARRLAAEISLSSSMPAGSCVLSNTLR